MYKPASLLLQALVGPAPKTWQHSDQMKPSWAFFQYWKGSHSVGEKEGTSDCLGIADASKRLTRSHKSLGQESSMAMRGAETARLSCCSASPTASATCSDRTPNSVRYETTPRMDSLSHSPTNGFHDLPCLKHRSTSSEGDCTRCSATMKLGSCVDLHVSDL